MDSHYVHDKAKYHIGSCRENGLSDDHAANHTVIFLRWLIERGLMSEEYEHEAADILQQFRAGSATIHQVYEYSDSCLIGDMLSEEGNAFAVYYFDFSKGRYPDDYIDTLDPHCVTVFHIKYSEGGYQKMREVMDRRYN